MKSLITIITIILLGMVVLLSACAVTNQVSTDFGDATRPPLPMPIRIQPCVDRTGTDVTDLGEQATGAFTEELNAISEFTVIANGEYELVCEVNGFLPGDAVKRWIFPGWGATVGRVSAMIQDAETKRILVIVEGDATMGDGGLYTIGAWREIVPTAVKATVSKLQTWAQGKDR